MQLLNLPSFNIPIEEKEGKKVVFDILRKKSILLTPEEWVRQNFIHFLIHKHNYPKGLIKVESGLKYNNLNKRSDILVYDRSGNIFLLVECKAAYVPINQKVLEQAALYNFSLKARFLLVTNGMKHFCFEIDHENKSYAPVVELPCFE